MMNREEARATRKATNLQEKAGEVKCSTASETGRTTKREMDTAAEGAEEAARQVVEVEATTTTSETKGKEL